MSKIKPYFSLSAITGQLSKIWKAIVAGILLSLGGAGFTILVARLTGTPVWVLTRDADSAPWRPPFVGLLSNWDVVLWIAAATICLFSAEIMKQQKAPDVTHKFLVVSGIFTLVLGLDDLYMLHDRILPRVLHIPEIFFYILYFLALVAYLVYFTPQLFKYENLLFATAIFFFALSRVFLIEIPHISRLSTGDILKYFGIAFWLIFFYRTALHEISARLGNEKSL
jgi:hypothetical protein